MWRGRVNGVKRMLTGAGLIVKTIYQFDEVAVRFPALSVADAASGDGVGVPRVEADEGQARLVEEHVDVGLEPEG